MGQQHSEEQGARNVSTGPFPKGEKGILFKAYSPAEQLSHELALRFARKVRRCLFGAVQKPPV